MEQMKKTWYNSTWSPFRDNQRLWIPFLVRGTWNQARFAFISFCVIFMAVFLGTVFGDSIKESWQDRKIKSQAKIVQKQAVELNSTKTELKNTVTQKNKEIKAVVAVLSEPNTKILKVVKGDTTLAVVKTIVDTAKHDTLKQ